MGRNQGNYFRENLGRFPFVSKHRSSFVHVKNHAFWDAVTACSPKMGSDNRATRTFVLKIKY